MNYYYHYWLSHYEIGNFLAKFYNTTILRRPQNITLSQDGHKKGLSINIKL